MAKRSKFKVRTDKHYLVDMTNFQIPVIVRKHLDFYQQAKACREKYFSKSKFEIATGKQVLEFGIKMHKWKKKGQRHKVFNKWQYPDHLITVREKQIWRINHRANMRKIKVEKIDVLKLINNNPSMFIKKYMANYRYNVLWYSKNPSGIKRVKKQFKFPFRVCIVFNIKELLIQEYGVENDQLEIAIHLYLKIKERIEKRIRLPLGSDAELAIYNTQSNIHRADALKEMRARGFIRLARYEDIDIYDDMAHLISNSHLRLAGRKGKRRGARGDRPTLIYPEPFYHLFEDKKKIGNKALYIHEATTMYGVGYWTGHLLNLSAFQ